MVVQYPYILEKFSQSESVYNPITGLWEQTEGQWAKVSMCRDENNSSGRVITIDGETFTYSALIQLPKGIYNVSHGEKIRVKDVEGNVRLEADIRGYSFRQLHSQIWV